MTQTYKCAGCSQEFEGVSAAPGTTVCPHCGGGPPFGASLKLQPARSVSSARLTLTTDQVLDTQRLTVLGLLGTLGVSVGLGLGFGIGGWEGATAGVLCGFGVPYLLAVAFRSRRGRRWLAKIADWATERPNLRR